MERNGLFVVLLLSTPVTMNAAHCLHEELMDPHSEYIISNKGYPNYNDNMSCSWTMKIPFDAQIEVACSIVDIQGMRGRCTGPDSLEIIERKTTYANNYYTYCGTFPIHEVFYTEELRFDFVVSPKNFAKFQCKLVALYKERGEFIDRGTPLAPPDCLYIHKGKSKCEFAPFAPFSHF